MAEIDKILRAKKIMADQESLVFMQPKPEKKEESKPVKKEEIKRKSLYIPEAT